MTRDLVCGMMIEEGKSRFSVILNKRVYRFCSIACMAEFHRHPEDYLGAETAPGNRFTDHGKTTVRQLRRI